MAIVTGVFATRASAEQAIAQLEGIGATEDQISVVMTDEARGKHFGLKKTSKADEGVAAGASVGGLIGVIAGAVLSAGALAIPGLNLVVSGAIISGLTGLGAGAVSGGLIGGLIGSGIPEHEAKMIEKEIRSGKVLLAFDARDSEQKKAAEEIFEKLETRKSAAA
jgi:hypothetical protein